MRYTLPGACLIAGFMAASPAFAQERSALLGESGYGCLQALIDNAPETSDDMAFEQSARFQACYLEAAFVKSCPQNRLSACALRNHGQIVTERYLAAARGASLSQKVQRDIEIVIGIRRPERYAKCLSDFGGDAKPASDKREDLVQAILKQRGAKGGCDAIFSLIDIAVIEGNLMMAAEADQ
ncbi:MAG: hypothetical protein AAF714_07960 [Pseudomonadota bacterium]